ncbi:MAG: aldo/keto reductase [Prochloraceae cyanobacterium]|nr:aldo/keto reductase [Prochloraceae cyanobacterium]
MTRRKFILGIAAAVGLVGSIALKKQPEVTVSQSLSALPDRTSMPEKILGNTGVSVPILGLGGAGKTPLSWNGNQQKAIALVERAIALGIRYFDTASSYGPSEENLGKVLPAYRDRVFLATKTAARDRDGAWRDLERSLKRLKTDYIDLWQLHHVSFREDLERIFSSRGAIKALEEAQQQGLVRFSGITGHHEPDVIAEGLRRYPFHTTLVALNAADAHHPRPFAPTVLPVAKKKNVGVIAMKVPAYGRLFKNGVLDGMHQAMRYSLSLDGVHCCIIAAENIAQLESNVRVAEAFQPLNEQEMFALEQRTANVWRENTFFRAWT